MKFPRLNKTLPLSLPRPFLSPKALASTLLAHFYFYMFFFRQEMIQRAEDRKADQTAHAQLVQSNYNESLARHEYAAQHPAYADGRVW